MTFPYQTPVSGGAFEHRAMECPEHGVGPFARPYGSTVAYQCVACLLEIAKMLEAGSARGPDKSNIKYVDSAE